MFCVVQSKEYITVNRFTVFEDARDEEMKNKKEQWTSQFNCIVLYYNSTMNESDLKVIERLWIHFFPKDRFFPKDGRIKLISTFQLFFKNNPNFQLKNSNYETVNIDIFDMQSGLPFDDFLPALRNQPVEILGCMVRFSIYAQLYHLLFIIVIPSLTCEIYLQGIALNLLLSSSNNSHQQIIPLRLPSIIIPRVYNLRPLTNFGDLKSNIVGQLVAIHGYVVRVSPSKPLVTGAKFKCPKCSEYTYCAFEDGVFNAPSICNTPK